ncbi:hypothetical protein D3C87_2027730 [compost metagenome]
MVGRAGAGPAPSFEGGGAAGAALRTTWITGVSAHQPARCMPETFKAPVRSSSPAGLAMLGQPLRSDSPR